MERFFAGYARHAYAMLRIIVGLCVFVSSFGNIRAAQWEAAEEDAALVYYRTMSDV